MADDMKALPSVDGEQIQHWTGFQEALRRCFYGASYMSDEIHSENMLKAESRITMVRVFGQGYRVGFELATKGKLKDMGVKLSGLYIDRHDYDRLLLICEKKKLRIHQARKAAIRQWIESNL